MKAREQLAILGGVRAVRIPEGRKPGLSLEAEQAAHDLLRHARRNIDRLSDLAGSGIVGEFEEALASHVGANHALSMSSGTAALTAALLACDVRKGNEV